MLQKVRNFGTGRGSLSEKRVLVALATLKDTDILSQKKFIILSMKYIGRLVSRVVFNRVLFNSVCGIEGVFTISRTAYLES